MNIVTYDDLLNLIESYNPEELERVKKAYQFAYLMHEGQVRKSGEPYIIHPLNVAYILASMHADGATLCAGLLHDTLEDTNTTTDDLVEHFGPEVTLLVNGVTNFSRSSFSSRDEETSANMRKIINGLMLDPRIIIIKLADRLHNMRTLEFKNQESQIRKSLETLEIFVPLAYYVGVNNIKSELEDLCLKYLKPDDFKKSSDLRLQIEEESMPFLNEMVGKVHALLIDNNIPNEIKIRIKNIYGVYKRKVLKSSDGHDLLAIKVMVDDIAKCYYSLGLIHSLYHPINGKFKDYICSPKTNMYSSLHTTVFAENNDVVQFQIKTFDMDFIASNGLPAYWDLKKGDAEKFMQDKLIDNSILVDSILEINRNVKNNKEFLKQVKKELLTDMVCIYTEQGHKIFLPKGATVIDLAYNIHTEIGNKAVFALVNGEEKPLSYVLKNNDCIKVITDENLLGPELNWLKFAKTSHARKRIRDFNKKKNNS